MTRLNFAMAFKDKDHAVQTNYYAPANEASC
jgi:hypothetical protein